MRSGDPQSPKQRRPKAVSSSIATNYVHLRNPYVVAWWSAAFPGFGHVSIGNYVIGFLLFGWEMLVNTQASLNIGIVYSFTGRFEMAKEVVNNRWLLSYAPVWVFAIWSSYRLAVDLNKISLLADRNHSPIDAAYMSSFEINILDKRSPWVAVLWTAFTPGLGHLYTHRIPTGFFLLIWWITMGYHSHLLQAAQYTALGLFDEATAVLDLEWILYMPSLMGFAIYDVYVNTVEYNRLFEREQADYLTREYQAPDFNMPKEGDQLMHVTASFEHSNFLELAITDLQEKGIEKNRICAIPLNKMTKERRLFDTLHRADGQSMFDLPAIIATIFMTLGVSWGFMWKWGPIIWGLLAFVGGLAVGLAIKYLLYKNSMKESCRGNTEVVLIVECKAEEVETVETVLFNHLAIGVGRKA